MADARPSMLYVQPTTGQEQPTQQTQPAKQPGWFQTHMERTSRAAWTAICFLVFCGFSFFLGWHLKGWHFSAYYEAPGGGSYLGAKPMPQQISQANPKVPGDAD